MVMLFEDRDTSGISKLLKYAYSEDKHLYNKILFSGGNKVITKYLESLKDENVIVYIDVMPDKVSTVNAYNECIDWINQNNCNKNMRVVLIPCIEYYVIKMFLDRNRQEVNTVIEFGNYTKVKTSAASKDLCTTDFENYCKSVLDNYNSCFKSKGKFYIFDCICNKGNFISSCYAITRFEKAWKLVTSLPIFMHSDNNTVPTERASIEDVVIASRKLYYAIGEVYKGFGIINEIPELISLER